MLEWPWREGGREEKGALRVLGNFERKFDALEDQITWPDTV